MRMCHSGAIALAVTNTRCHFAGTSGNPMWPALAMRAIEFVAVPAFAFAMVVKSSFTSGMRTPA